MTWSEEIFRSLFALWRILKFDPQAPAYFNLTEQGFWRSFLAAAVANVVGHAMLQPLLALAPAEVRPVDLNGVLIREIAVGFVIMVVFPLLMVPVSRMLNLDRNYVTYIIAWNWSSWVMLILLVPISLFALVGLLSFGVVGLLQLILFVVAVFVGILVARAALECNGFVAAGLMLLEFVLARFLFALVP